MNTNPWLGLKSYEENDQLYGRQKESDELANIVINSFHTIIYGKSGIGKTSLLRAGVFPTLRYEDFMPIYIRLEHKENAEEDYYLRQIEEFVGKTHGCESLNAIFSSCTFAKSRGIEQMPVFVFDQFEEIFTLNENRESEAVSRFFADLSDILNDSSDRYNFRIVICLREDYLYYIERLSESIPAFKRNRYCLQDLTNEEALEVITQPCAGMVDDAVAQEILHKLSPKRTNEVNATILSLYMSQLYDKMVKSGDKVISSSLIRQFGDDIISAFYFESIAGVSERSIEYLEDHLITTGGYRHNVPMEDAMADGVRQLEINHLKERRILNVQPHRGNILYMEYAHDVLCPIVVINREKRALRKKAKRQRKLITAWVASVLVLLAIVGGMVAMILQISRKQEAMMLMQSRAIAGQAKELRRDGHYIKGVALCLMALPKDLNNPDRPVSYEAITELSNFIYTDFANCKIVLNYGNPAKHASFSPDSRYVVTASDNVARIWDVETGDLIKEFKGHKEGVGYAKFSPDGKYLATASADSTARIWNVATGKQIKCFRHRDRVRSVSFSPDGRYVVTVSDSMAYILNVSTGRKIKTLKGHEDKVTSANFSPDGQFIATSSYDNTARIWSVATGRQIRILKHKDDYAVHAATFSHNGRYIVTSSADINMYIWDVMTGKRVDEIKNESSMHYAIFSPDDNHIIYGGFCDSISIWNVSTREKERKYNMTQDTHVDYLECSPDGRYFVSCSDWGFVMIWNLSLMENHFQIKDQKDRTAFSFWRIINPDAISFDGRNVAVSYMGADGYGGFMCGNVKYIDIYDIPTGSYVKSIETDTVVSLASFSPDGKSIIATGRDGIAKVWNVETGKKIMTIDAKEVMSAKFSLDGRYIVTASADSTARLWNASTGDFVRVFRGHTNAVSAALFSPNGRYLVTASQDSTAKVWEVSTGNLIKTLFGHTGYVMSASFSPDGQSIVTASLDSTVRIWNVSTGCQVKLLAGHGEKVISAVYSPNGKYVITSPLYGNSIIWDVSAGQAVQNVDKESSTTATFTPDGRYVLSTIRSGFANCELNVLRFYEPQELIDHFRSVVGDYQFTPDEEIKYYLK